MLLLIVLTVMGVGLVLALVAWLATRGPSEHEIFRRFDALEGFTITERHAYEGSGIAADEARGRVAVIGKGLEKHPPVLLAAKDLVAWRYQAKDQCFEMTVKSRRHAQPFLILFRKRATADEWLKIFRNIVEER